MQARAARRVDIQTWELQAVRAFARLWFALFAMRCRRRCWCRAAPFSGPFQEVSEDLPDFRSFACELVMWDELMPTARRPWSR
jgi:hypothetical protein